MEDVVEQAEAWIMTNGLDAVKQLVLAILIFVLGRWAARFARGFIRKLMEKSRIDETLISFTTNLVYGLLVAFVVVAALGQVGVQTASFIAVLGAAGLAVGLALQGSLANFAAGVLMMIFKPFKVGDFVEAGGTSGIVLDISIFTTILKTGDNKRIIVPNAKISGDNITNYSAHDTRRVDMVIGVGYADDLDKVRKALEDVLSSEERVLEDPCPTIGVLELADSSVNFAVRPWVKTADYWPALFALQESIKKRFDAEDISIPFPQRDLHVYKETQE